MATNQPFMHTLLVTFCISHLSHICHPIRTVHCHGNRDKPYYIVTQAPVKQKLPGMSQSTFTYCMTISLEISQSLWQAMSLRQEYIGALTQQENVSKLLTHLLHVK